MARTPQQTDTRNASARRSAAGIPRNGLGRGLLSVCVFVSFSTTAGGMVLLGISPEIFCFFLGGASHTSDVCFSEDCRIFDFSRRLQTESLLIRGRIQEARFRQAICRVFSVSDSLQPRTSFPAKASEARHGYWGSGRRWGADVLLLASLLQIY